MKKLTKTVISLLATLGVITSFSACDLGGGGGSSHTASNSVSISITESGTDSVTESQQASEKESSAKPEKKYEPLIKEDLMWDTETVFNKQVTVTEGVGTFKNDYGKTKAIFMDGDKYKGKDTTCFAYIGHPSSEMPEGGYPGIVLVHGGGGCAFYEWVEYWNSKGYVAIAIDTYGHQYGSKANDGNNTASVNPNAGPTDSGSFGNTASDFKDSWIYHSVYNIISAHNILLSDETVNSEKTVLTGISWGSVLTEITSGVDYRFKAFAPVYGSGFLLEAPGVLASSYYKPPKDMAEWMELYDPTSYLQYCNRPIMFTVGTDEHFFTPVLVEQSAGLCQGDVYFSYRQSLSHYHRWKDEEDMINVYKFLDSVINPSPLPFKVVKEKCKDGRITVEMDDMSNVKTVKVVWATDTKGSSKTWPWDYSYVKDEEIVGNTVTVDVPEDAKVCFLEFSDDAFRTFIMSSRLYEF